MISLLVSTNGSDHVNVLAIIPAYNEEESLLNTVEELRRVVPSFDYVVINDGSSDGTEEICRTRGLNHVTHPVNLGLTAGFQTGVRYALNHGYDAVVQFDADGQHRPEYLKTLMEEMELTGVDIVIGSRFINASKSFSARMIGSRLITFIILLTTGVRVTDPTSGLRLYNRRAMEAFAEKYDFGPEPDSVAYLIRHGFRVSEVQVSMRARQAGESYLGLGKSIQYMARVVVSVLFAQWFR